MRFRPSPFAWSLAASLATGCVGQIHDGSHDSGTSTDTGTRDSVASDTPATDTPPPSDAACVAPRATCGASCVDLQTDTANCGSCGNACAAGQFCAGGSCGSTCAMTMCGSACVNTQTDSANCGSCGHACGAGTTCASGSCACTSGTTMCGAACVNTQSDPANCGSCGHVCAGGEHCSSGTCMPGTVCPDAPAGVSADAAAALQRENQVRVAMGLDCATMVPTANAGADAHCRYYSANRGNSSCVGNPHVEVAGCMMFYAANFWERMSMAGYTGSPASEDMAFSGNGASAVQQWIDSVWHRTPVLSPWERDIGYGGGSGTGCDTMDFGTGAASPSTIVATYPYANQTGVPTSFDGRYEGPTPPAPPSGWPSGYPIHIYIRGTITAHDIVVDGTTTTVPHVWLDPADASTMGLLRNQGYVFYTNAPLTAGTRYHVTATGSNSAGPVNLDWVFTTR